MAKAQHHHSYRTLPDFLRNMRESAGLTQRELGKKLKEPQSWIYNCETGNRRVDIAEFIRWANACGQDPEKMFHEFREKTS